MNYKYNSFAVSPSIDEVINKLQEIKNKYQNKEIRVAIEYEGNPVNLRSIDIDNLTKYPEEDGVLLTLSSSPYGESIRGK